MSLSDFYEQIVYPEVFLIILIDDPYFLVMDNKQKRLVVFVFLGGEISEIKYFSIPLY